MKLVLIFLLTFTLILLEPHAVPTASAKTMHPVKVIDVSVGVNQRDDFIKQIVSIADKQRLAIRTDHTEPSGTTVLIQLWRSDLWAIVDNTARPNTYTFALYSIGLTPESAEDDARTDFIEDLKKAVKCLPGATITITK
jgi:hypothetical protein